VSRIEQIVGLLAVSSGDGDGIVQATDVACQTIDLISHGGHLLVDKAVLLGKTVIDSIEAPRQTFGLGQYQLPCGNIGRVFSSCLQSREEALQRRRNACGSTCQQRIELADLALVGLDVAVERGAATQLSREKLAVGAADVHQSGA